MKLQLKDIITQGLIAAVYFCITLLTYQISFLGIQFRIAEALMLLIFFNKKYSIGLTIGCIISNLTSSIGPIDALFGSIATISACLVLSFSKWMLPAIIFTIASNAFIVGAELYFLLQFPFWLSCAQVAIGEATVLLVAYIFVLIFKKNDRFYRIIDTTQNKNFKF